jgi:hypothetical protein
MTRKEYLPDGYFDIFDVSQLPSTHQGAYVERGGKAIRTTTDQGFLCFGQYKRGYPLIPLQAVFSILIDNNTGDDRNILILDVYDHHSDRIIGKQLLTRKDFPKANEFCVFSFDFTPPSQDANMEFRIYYMGYAYILANKIAVIDPAKISIHDASEIPGALSGIPTPPPPSPPELPAPWKIAVIGNGQGTVTLRDIAPQVTSGKNFYQYGATFEIDTKGAIRDQTDDCYFIYLEWSKDSGNGKIVAKFSHQEGFVGVMFRESLHPDSRFIMLENQRILYRERPGGPVVESVLGDSKQSARGIRLARRGGTNKYFLGAFSVITDDDFLNNTQIPFQLAQQVYVGLAAGTSRATVNVGIAYKDKTEPQ